MTFKSQYFFFWNNKQENFIEIVKETSALNTQSFIEEIKKQIKRNIKGINLLHEEPRIIQT